LQLLLRIGSAALRAAALLFKNLDKQFVWVLLCTWWLLEAMYVVSIEISLELRLMTLLKLGCLGGLAETTS
jgi:hypothetical protein